MGNRGKGKWGMGKKLAASGAANVPSVIGAANVPVCEAAEKLVFGFGKALRASADGDVCHSVIVDVCRSFFLADGDVCHFGKGVTQASS